MLFRKPDGSYVQKTATIIQDSGFWKVRYVTEADFLDQLGRWRAEGNFTLGAWTGSTEAVEFQVDETYQ